MDAPSASPATGNGATILELQQVTTPLLPHPISLTIAAGEEVILVTPRQGVNRSILRLLAGLEAPAAGTITVFGRTWAELSPRTMQEKRRRLAIVYATGGLIANLKVWENLLLPLSFHGRADAAALLRLGEDALARVGYTGGRQILPDLLTPAEQKGVELARAILMRPELIVYDSPQQGMTRGELRRFLRVAAELHREQPGRASLYLTSDTSLLRFLPGMRISKLVDGTDYDD